MENKKIEVLIPVYKPGPDLEKLLTRLEGQSCPPARIRIINTEKKYWDFGVEERHPGIVVEHISRSEFDHGGTRRRLAKSAQGDVMIFMTQDALPADSHLIEELLKALEPEGVKAAYARQLPRKGASVREAYTRSFNYPPSSRIKWKRDKKELGIKTYFCSNVCAAYDRAAYEELGGFVERAIFNEDMIYAAHLIEAGWGVAYAAGAKVYHSHDYTGREQFRRNFDLGVSQAEHPEVFENLPSEGEGIRLVTKTMEHLWAGRRFGELVPLIWQSGCKYLGYRLGRHYRRLPKKLILRCTMNKPYWK